jgi:hypothetical protein
LRDKLADEAIICAIATGLSRVVGAMRFGGCPQLVRRAGKRMQTRPAKSNGRVAREHRGEQKMSNDLRHQNIVGRETNPEIITVNEFVLFVNTQVFENSLSAVREGKTMWP